MNITRLKQIASLIIVATAAYFATSNEAIAQTDQYWRTDGTSGQDWTGLNWNTGSANSTGGTAWTSGDNAFFTANSTPQFQSTAVGNVTVSANQTVTVTSNNTLTLGGVRTFDIGAGAILTWTSQGQSVAASNEGAGVIKNGAGTLNWGAGTASVRYNGGFTINNGAVIASGANSFTSGTLTLNGGTIESSGGISFAPANVVIGGDFSFTGTGSSTSLNAPVSLGTATRAVTVASGISRNFSQTVSGTGGLTKSGSGSLGLNAANTFTGDTTVSGGNLTLSNNLALQNSALNTSGSGTITLSPGTTTPTLGGLKGSKNITSVITSGYTSVTSLTLNSGTATSNTYSGVISNGAAGMSLTKTGDGTQTLSGANTYTGGTTISQGTLLVTNTAGSATGSGAVTVESGGILGGTGQITSATTVTGTLMAGNGSNATGTLTLAGDLTLDSASELLFSLNASSNSSLAQSGSGSWSFQTDQTVRFLDFGATPGTYTGILTGLASDPMASGWTIANSGWTGSFAYNSGSLDFTLTAVPEPSTVIAALLVFGGLCWMRHRRTRTAA